MSTACLPMALGPAVVVIVHAWHWDEGSQTYSDPVLDRVDGWTAYVRTRLDGEPDGCFQSEELGDTETQGQAEILARIACDRLGLSHDLICVEA